MSETNIYIFDFDSTLVQVEALDELANIALSSNNDRSQIVSKIKEITTLGMEGKITFPQSLAQRLRLFSPTINDINSLISLLKSRISASVARNLSFFHNNNEKIYIISGGFREYILPIAGILQLPEKNILANSFLLKNDRVVGIDSKSLMAQEKGKVLQVQALKLSGKIHVIGDGFTDLQIKLSGQADCFYAYTENVSREDVVRKADHNISSIEELISCLNFKQ